MDAYRFAKYASGAAAAQVITETLSAGAATIASIDNATAALDDAEVPYEGRILFVNPNTYKLIKGGVTRMVMNGENNVNYNVEIYNDMRRYDYNPAIFFNWVRPARQQFVAGAMQAVPAGKYIRRWCQCSHEYRYNAKQLQAIGEKVPGATTKDGNGNEIIWNRQPDVWTIPVWWDSAQE
jgi:hypothetical protein